MNSNKLNVQSHNHFLFSWLLIHVKNDQKAARAFMECMERNSRPMGISASKPKIIVLDNDRNETYAQTLRQALNVETQIVVCICPTSRDDRYNAIKKICCAESPIPSQVPYKFKALVLHLNRNITCSYLHFPKGHQCTNIEQRSQKSFNCSEDRIANELQNGRQFVVNQNSVEECHGHWH